MKLPAIKMTESGKDSIPITLQLTFHTMEALIRPTLRSTLIPISTLTSSLDVSRERKKLAKSAGEP
jgi:hypothetical protein